jgi:glycosyltransferase Alg8
MSIRYDVSLGMRLIRAVPVIAAYGALVFFAYGFLPRDVGDEAVAGLALIGAIGAWRYIWLLIHCVRAALYEFLVYPKIRFETDSMPDDEKYPGRLFYVIPTFREKPEVSRRSLNSVLDEVASLPCETIIFVNAGSEEEDQIFKDALAEHRYGDQVQMVYIRQKGGKRQGMADVLYAMSEYDVTEDDTLVLMDGDTVLGRGILSKCIPLFAYNSKLAAVTTDNIAVTEGNWIYRKWYTLRFAMRHRYMKSQSLSRQLMVLTGRFSMFRALHCVNDEFIAFLENDRIKHWLHGEIKFVTGDDKSTWYCLLRQGYEMLYVPDAHIYCMEHSGKKPIMGSIKKMHRWFGNMLRNNGRAIGLGMGAQKPFIWWCLVDQRISMWTSLLSPIAALWGSVWLSPYYLVVYGMLVIIVRILYAIILTFEGHRMSLFDVPLLLYTQWGGAMVKTYTLFHLHKQKWDAREKGSGKKNREPLLNFLIPKLEMAFCYFLLMLFVAYTIGVK